MAVGLSRARDAAKGGPTLPPLLFVTDPARTQAPWETAGRLPRGAGVVFRAFGAPDAVATGRRLMAVAEAGGLTVLVGADAGLATAIGAHGLHLPERDLDRASGLRRGRPDWIITGAAHSAAALARARGLDAALVSPVFDSASSSAGAALGPAGFAALVRGAPLPVYALGGITAANAGELTGTGACGLAAVDGVVAAFGRG